MESSQVLGSADQESGYSESGWTMYIGSQICNENYGEADEGIDNENTPVSHGGGGEESDDSMASDASSGPILHELMIPDGVKKGSEMLGGVMDRVNAEGSKCLSANKKTCKQEKKKRDEIRIKREKKAQQKVLPKADSAESQA